MAKTPKQTIDLKGVECDLSNLFLTISEKDTDGLHVMMDHADAERMRDWLNKVLPGQPSIQPSLVTEATALLAPLEGDTRLAAFLREIVRLGGSHAQG